MCVSWDANANAWTDDGCEEVGTFDEGSTVCECGLKRVGTAAAFALLDGGNGGLEGAGEGTTSGALLALQIFSYIAIVIALICIVFIIYKVRSYNFILA